MRIVVEMAAGWLARSSNVLKTVREAATTTAQSAIQRNAGGRNGWGSPGVSDRQSEIARTDGKGMADDDAPGAGAAAVRRFDELVSCGAEAGEDEELAAEPSGERGDENEEGFAEGRDQEISLTRHSVVGMHRLAGARPLRARIQPKRRLCQRGAALCAWRGGRFKIRR